MQPSERRFAVLLAPRLWKIVFWSGVAAVCALSLLPQQALPRPGVSDKLLHLAAYFVLMAVSYPAYGRGTGERRIVAGLVVLGLALELVQTVSPLRVMSVADAAAGAAGVALAMLAARATAGIGALRRRRRAAGGALRSR